MRKGQNRCHLPFEEKETYIEMIINILKDHYKDEYDLLVYLANEDFETFKFFAKEARSLISHLEGYGIIEQKNFNYNFKIESIKKYLRKMNKYKKSSLSREEKYSEISERRNFIEIQLRKLIKQQMVSAYGKTNAKKYVLESFKESDKNKANNVEYKDMFNPNLVNIYFYNLIYIIENHYSKFQNIFEEEKNSLISKLKNINQNRIDAHASEIADTEFQYLRMCFEKIENSIKNYLD